MAKTAIYILTQQGAMTAENLIQRLDADIYVPPAVEGFCSSAKPIPYDSLRALIAKTFTAYRQHVFVTAAGVAVRCIAPHLKDKTIDPAVVVMDQHGRHVISILSGHLGGANALAQEVASITGGQAVITTATDMENLPALDILALECNLTIANIKAVAKVNSALLAGRTVLVDDPGNALQLKESAWKELFVFTGTPEFASLTTEEAAAMARVTVTPTIVPLSETNLVLHPKILHVGIGCRRGAKARTITGVILNALEQLELSPGSIADIASVDVKRYEKGLIETAASFDVPLRFFSAKELDSIPVTSPSHKAQEVFGVDGVCEPSAMLAAGENALLCLPKRIIQGVTIAIAQEITQGEPSLAQSTPNSRD